MLRVKESHMPRKYIRDSSSDRFYGINGSGLEIIGRIEATVAIDHREYKITLRVMPDTTMKASLVLRPTKIS